MFRWRLNNKIGRVTHHLWESSIFSTRIEHRRGHRSGVDRSEYHVKAPYPERISFEDADEHHCYYSNLVSRIWLEILEHSVSAYPHPACVCVLYSRRPRIHKRLSRHGSQKGCFPQTSTAEPNFCASLLHQHVSITRHGRTANSPIQICCGFSVGNQVQPRDI